MNIKKGIAVSQIILLVLGILVLAVVSFLLYSNFVQTGSTLTAEQCRAAATRACTACSIAQLGDTSSCDARTFLSPADYMCASQGQIPNVLAVTNSDGKVTGVSGGIPCSQYVGSPNRVALGSMTCSDGSTPTAMPNTSTCVLGTLPVGNGCCSA